MCSTPKQSLPHWAALICESLQTQLMELTANPCLLCRRTFTFYLMLFPVRLLGKMLKKLTYPEFDLSRIIYSTDYKPTCLPTILSCFVSQLLTVLFCPAPIPTIQITLSISTSVLHSLVCPHLLFTALPYASICLNCKCGNLSSLAPVPSYRGRVPETMLGWSLKSRDEIIWELTCSTIYLKCKWNSDFFFQRFMSWPGLRRGKNENWSSCKSNPPTELHFLLQNEALQFRLKSSKNSDLRKLNWFVSDFFQIWWIKFAEACKAITLWDR